MSSLQSINGFNLDSDLVQKFLKDYTILAKNGKNIIFCWIPSHVGILLGNVMKKQMQLQSGTLLTCHSYEASCYWQVSSYN